MRYPYKAPVSAAETFLGDDATGATGMIDYLKIRRQRTTYRDGKYYGANTDFLPSSDGVKNQHRSTVYLSLPAGINAQYQPVYRQVNLGVGGAAAIDALGAGSAESLAVSLQNAASALRPEFLASALAQGANAVSGFFGVQGNLDANVLSGLSSGKVFNPYTEQLFSQMNFRNHSFNIKMLARNYREAQEIKNIIQYLKVGAHPQVTGGDFTNLFKKINDEDAKEGSAYHNNSEFQDQAGDLFSSLIGSDGAIGELNDQKRFFQIPDHYDLDYLRIDPDMMLDTSNGLDPELSSTQRLHYRMQACVCSGINVNYTPDNQYTSFKSVNGTMIQVPAVILNIQFTEVKLLNQDDIIAGF